MHLKPILICLGLLAAIDAHADNTATPQPLAVPTQARSASGTATKLGAPRRMPSPTISVTRVTRQADGTLATDCVQRPNPKLRAQSGGAQP
jgi:hypothetical protein